MVDDMTTRLATRAYMYEIFHMVFGAEPTPEMLARLGDDMTISILSGYTEDDRAADDPEEAEDGASLDAYMRCLRTLEEISKGGDAAVTLDALTSSYTRLFMVPGEEYVHPWESPYRGKEVMLFQESTLDVRARYRAFGFEAEGYKHFPEDHIAMMMHFLGALSSEAYAAHEEHTDARLMELLEAQRSFIDEHLTYWRPRFIEALELKDSLGFYLMFARTLDAFLTDDRTFLREVLSR